MNIDEDGMIQKTLKVISIFILATILNLKLMAATCTDTLKAMQEKAERSSGLFSYDSAGNFLGLNEKGLKVIGEARMQINEANAIVNQQVFEREAVLDAYRVAQVARYNIVHSGPMGGSKTALPTLLMGPLLWSIQMHQGKTEMALVGGQTHRGIQKGKEEINTKDTAVEATFALIDEGEKSSAPALSSALVLLNERGVFINGKFVEAPYLRSLIFTGNFTHQGFIDYMTNAGMETTGAPFLNRFAISISTSSLLHESNQESLNRQSSERLAAKAGTLNSNIHKKRFEELTKKPAVDLPYEDLRDFANGLFEIHPSLRTVIIALSRQVKAENLKYKRAVAEDLRSHGLAPFYPVASINARFEKMYEEAIRVSAALDFLKSPLSEPEELKKINGKIVLGPNSAWRLYALLTSVMERSTVFDPDTKEIYFGALVLRPGQIQPYNLEQAKAFAENDKEAWDLAHKDIERKIFLSALKSVLQKYNESGEEVRAIFDGVASADSEQRSTITQSLQTPNDFEVRLSRAGGTSVMKVQPAN